MARTSSIDKSGLKKGAWSEEEDNKLRTYVLRYGHWNWRQLPKFAGLSRCGKSCRLRWMNYLRPGLKRGNYSIEEGELILKLHQEFGNRWSAIAAKLPGRSDNEIKNYWHTHLRKSSKQDPKPTKKIMRTREKSQQHMDDADQSEQSSAISISDSTDEKRKMAPEIATAAAAAAADCDSGFFDGAECIVEDSISSEESFAESFGGFWTERFSLDTSYNNLEVNWVPPIEEEVMNHFSPFLDEDLDWFNEMIQ